MDEREPGSGPGPLVTNWLKNFTIQPDTAIVDFLVQLNGAIQHDVGYSVRMEPGVQTPDYTLSSAIGSCRDSAWLLVSLLRELGLAARFVSGYLVQLTSDIASLDGPSGPSADFTDLHAWAEVYIPGAGWIGMDPTSGLFAGEGHIPLSATPHPTTAAAITGSTGIAQTTLEYSNVVRRIHEDPRVTLPYTPDAVGGGADVGALVDKRLEAGDVRMTMGGEPTFVSDRRRHLRRVDHRRRRPEEAASGPACWPSASARSTHPAASCTAVRASGIRESRCRAGRSPCTGAPTGCRSGPIRRCWPTRGPSDGAEAAAPRGSCGAGAPARNWPARFIGSGGGVLRAARQPGAAGLRGRAGQARAAGPDAGRRAGGRRHRQDSPDARAALLARAGRVGHRGQRLRAAAAPTGRARLR